MHLATAIHEGLSLDSVASADSFSEICEMVGD